HGQTSCGCFGDTVYRHTPASWLRRAGYGSGEYAPAHASRKGPARVHERTHIPGTPAGRTPAPHSHGELHAWFSSTGRGRREGRLGRRAARTAPVGPYAG